MSLLVRQETIHSDKEIAEEGFHTCKDFPIFQYLIVIRIISSLELPTAMAKLISRPCHSEALADEGSSFMRMNGEFSDFAMLNRQCF